MKHKNRKYYVIIPAIIILGSIFVLNPTGEELSNVFNTGDFNIDFDFDFSGSKGLKSNDINGGTFSSTGQLYSLSFTNWLYECNAESDLFVLINGNWVKVVSDSDFFNTIIGADIQRKSTGEIINEFRMDNYLTCDYPNSGVQSLKVSGHTTLGLFTGTYSEKLLKTDKVSIPSTVLPDNTKVKVSSFKWTSSSIESLLILNSNGNGWVNAIAQINGNYVMTFNDGSTQLSSATGTQTPISETRYYVSVIDTPEEIIEDANRQNAVMEITDVTQTKTNLSIDGSTMDLDKGQQIKVKAYMRDYRDTDGLPVVNIVGPGVNVKINMKLINIDSNKDGFFETYFLLPRDGSVGQWNLKMTHAFRSTFSTSAFNVIDSGAVVTVDPTTGEETTTNSDGQIIKTSTDTTTSTNSLDKPTVITKMHYIHRYDNVPECSITTGECKLVTKTLSGIGDTQKVQLNSLTDSISYSGKTGVEAILDEVQITTVVSADFDTLKDIKRATNSDMVYQATLLPEGSTPISFTPFTIHSPQPNICFGVTNESSCPPNGGMQLDVITISDSKIEQELKNKGVKSVGQKVLLSVMAIDGTFTILDKDNKEHLGSAKGTAYEYQFTYGATPVNDPTKTSSSDSCTSSDPKVGCECPTGQIFSYSNEKQELVCVDPSTGEETTSKPKSNTSNTAESEFITNNEVEPYCETNSNGEVIATFGNVSVDDPNCASLFGKLDGVDNASECPAGTTAVANDIKPVPPNEPNYFCVDNVEISNGQIEGDPEEEVKGKGSTQPLIDCEETFGQQFCALASGDPSGLFSDNGVEPKDNTLAVIGILIAIIVIIIALAVGLKRRNRY